MDAPRGSRLTERARRTLHRDALGFVAERYALAPEACAALGAIPIRWRRGRGSSAFYPRAAHGFHGPHILLRIPPGARVRWHTYRRARARFATPREGIEIDARVLAGAVLVHELTHAVQAGIAGSPRRRFSEVETTENEIEFVRRADPAACARLVAVARRPARRPGAARARPAPAAGRGLAALRALVLRFAARLGGFSPASAPARSPPTTRRRTRSPTPTGS